MTNQTTHSTRSEIPHLDINQTVRFLQDMIRIPSLSNSPEELQAAERMVQEMHALGFDEAWQDEKGNAIGLYRGANSGANSGKDRSAAWLLLTHVDIVSVGDLALWKHEPFAGIVEDGWVHGRGSVDIKGPLVAQVYSVAALINAGVRPPNDIVVLAAVEEETAGQGAEYFVNHLPLKTPSGEEIQIGACIVGEPSRNRVMLGHRGVTRILLNFQGNAHHASRAIAEQNPYFALGTFLERLSEAQLRDHHILGLSTIAPTMIHADTRSQNVTPNSVQLLLDWRYSTETQAEMQAIVEHLVQGLNVSFQTWPAWTHGEQVPLFAGPGGQNSPGFFIERDHPLVKLLDAALHNVSPDAPEPGVWHFATDGRFFMDRGIPTVGFGPGNELLAHTTEEAIPVSDLVTHITVLTQVLQNPIV